MRIIIWVARHYRFLRVEKVEKEEFINNLLLSREREGKREKERDRETHTERKTEREGERWNMEELVEG